MLPLTPPASEGNAMRPPNTPTPSVRSLISSWIYLTGWIIRAIAARAGELADRAGVEVKDAILDLGCHPADAESSPDAEPAPLPSLCPDEFVAALHGPVEQVLRRVAEVINEDPCGHWTSATEDRVVALFRELGQEALEQALLLRVAAAEPPVSSGASSGGEWVKKYRLMLAQEGRWPPAPEEQHSTLPTC
jgi:hypothetical protein